MARKPVKVHYRRLYRTSDPPFPELLSQKASAALQARIGKFTLVEEVSLRRYEDVDGASLLLNGIHLSTNGDVFGEMLRYNPDTNIPLVIQSSGPIAEPEIREANRPNGADFLRGMNFFLIRGDHVLIIEQDLGAGALERYLRWMIFTASRSAERDTRLQLIPRAFFEGGVLKEVTSIQLKPPSSGPDMLPSVQAGAHTISGEVPETNIFAILKAAHFDTAVLDRITGTDGTSVQVTINVEFKAGRNKLHIAGDDAVALLRHVPEEELIIKGVGAQKNRGVLERLDTSVSVEQKGNILVRQDAWNKLIDAAAEHRTNGWMP